MNAPGPGHVLDEEKLSGAERKLLAASAKGALTDLRAGIAEANDPAAGAKWGTGRRIRAELLIELLTGQRHPAGRPARAVKLIGARITGSLGLEAATLTCPLLLQDCYIDESVNFNEADAPAIRLPGCHLPGLTASQLHTAGDLELRRAKLTADSEVNLLGARIDGALDLRGASLSNPGGRALWADRLTVGQNMLCWERFAVVGEVQLRGARIGGQLNLAGASLSNPGGRALRAERLTVGHSMICSDGFAVVGEVCLSAAHIVGQLRLEGASLSNPGGSALAADRLTVEEDVLCCDGFTADGEIQLSGAHISGHLDMTGARLANPGKRALTGDYLAVDRGMSFRNGSADGEVNLLRAHVGGALDLMSAHLAMGTEIDAPTAVNGSFLTVDQDMFCAFLVADGEVRLHSARIGGQLSVDYAQLANPDANAYALSLDRAEITDLNLRMNQPPAGKVGLAGAKVGRLHDRPESWPAIVDLRGFVYDIGQDTATTGQRLDWLARQEGGYAPQPYDQLATAYRRKGDEQAARKIAIAKQRRRRHAYSPLSWLWYLTVGYGYRPWLAGVWVIALVVLGTVVFSSAYPAHMIATSQHPPAFHAAAYALDLLLPVIGFGQKAAWQPQGAAYQYWSWVLTGAGWILTTAVVTGLAGILKRD